MKHKVTVNLEIKREEDQNILLKKEKVYGPLRGRIGPGWALFLRGPAGHPDTRGALGKQNHCVETFLPLRLDKH